VSSLHPSLFFACCLVHHYSKCVFPENTTRTRTKSLRNISFYSRLSEIFSLLTLQAVHRFPNIPLAFAGANMKQHPTPFPSRLCHFASNHKKQNKKGKQTNKTRAQRILQNLREHEQNLG
jgi:hypothetical protein